MYIEDLALDNLQGLTCHKTSTTPNLYKVYFDLPARYDDDDDDDDLFSVFLHLDWRVPTWCNG